MSRGVWQATIVDELGNVLPSSSISVRDQGGALVALYDAAVGGSALPNPFTADAEGFARFYVEPDLLDITATSGGSVRVWEAVNIGDAALRQELAASPSTGQGAALVNGAVIYVGSVAELEALSVSVGANVKTLGYYAPGDGGGNDYEIVAGATGTADGGSFIDLDNGLQARGLFENQTVTPNQFGAVGDEVSDDTSKINFASATGLQVLLLSKYKITDKINFLTGQKVIGVGRNECGFVVNADFNMAADGIIQAGTAEPGAELSDFGIFAFQDSAATTRAELIQYPYAINGIAVPRIMFNRLRMERVYNGINITGNAGGIHAKELEIGALNIGIKTDGAKDFIYIDNVEFWPFGFAGTSLYTDVYSDGSTIAIDGNDIDGIAFGTITSFRARVIINGGFGSIATFLGDGRYSRLEISGGAKLSIGAMYSSSDAADDFAVKVSGANTKCVIGAMWLENATNLTGSDGLLQCLTDASAELIIGELHAKTSGPNTRLIYQTQGTVSVGSGFLEPPQNVDLVNDYIESVAGDIHLRGLRATDKGTGAGNLINIATDRRHSLQNVIAPQWPVSIPADSEIMQISDCEFFTKQAGSRVISGRRVYRLTGTLDGSGAAEVVHGLAAPQLKYPEIFAMRNNEGARFPINVNFIDGVKISVSSASGAAHAGQAVEVSITI